MISLQSNLSVEIVPTMSPIAIAAPVEGPDNLFQVHFSILAGRRQIVSRQVDFSIPIGLSAAQQFDLYTISRRVRMTSILDIVCSIVIIPLFVLSPWFFIYVRHH